jgi:hypothetical protein
MKTILIIVILYSRSLRRRNTSIEMVTSQFIDNSQVR